MASQDRKRTPRTPAHKEEDGECVIPGAMPAEALGDYVLPTEGTEADRIRSYVEWQAHDEVVQHLEKVATEWLYGQRLDAWDVKTDKDRWWVITNPTNLYSQRLFPSLDYTISFHVGVTTRIAQAEITEEQEDAHDNVNQLWNRIARARMALFSAEEAEDFQSVGMRCREALLLLVQKLGTGTLLPADQELPQRANFVAWSELLADNLAGGESRERLRAYLKAISKSTWQFTNWLTHARNAGRHDCAIAIEATENVLSSFMTAWINVKGPRGKV